MKASIPQVKSSQPGAQPNKYRPLQNCEHLLVPRQEAGAKNRQRRQG